MNQASKKLLLITHDYPPHGITASRRPGGFSKYLPENGWQTIVLTRRWTKANCNFDSSIVPNLPQNKIYEVDEFRSPLFSRAGFQEQVMKVIQPGLHPYSFYKPAREEVERIVKGEKFDAILATAPQSNVFSLARYASELSGKPWVADFRDAWQWVPNLKSKLAMPLVMMHEKDVIQHAARVTTVSQGLADLLAQRHGKVVEVISHGFDEELIPEKYPTQFPKFNIVYTGGLILGNPNLRPLLDAIGNLIDKGYVDKQDVSIEFYGKGNERRINELFADHKYFSLVRDFGAVPRMDVITCQQSAALLLVASHPGMPGWITSKLFEYIISGRPILSIPRDPDCIDQVLQKTEAGISCSSISEIEEVLLAFYREWKETGTILFKGNMQAINDFSTRAQTKKVADILDSLVETGRDVHQSTH